MNALKRNIEQKTESQYNETVMKIMQATFGDPKYSQIPQIIHWKYESLLHGIEKLNKGHKVAVHLRSVLYLNSEYTSSSLAF